LITIRTFLLLHHSVPLPTWEAESIGADGAISSLVVAENAFCLVEGALAPVRWSGRLSPAAAASVHRFAQWRDRLVGAL
jgi:hypothetical protein